VNPTTVSHLLDLNRQFYQTFGEAFSSTRQRIQPGVLRLFGRISQSGSILDLGCGNGELAHRLASNPFTGSYTGLDLSAPLLEHARKGQLPGFHFLQADLSSPDWDARFSPQGYDCLLAFAVLHHLPGAELRLQVLRKARSLMPGDGIFIHSEWQFLNSPRLAARLQPWEAVGLASGDVDPGDYLLDWRHGGKGLRYVHHFNEDELSELADAAGFKVTESFFSDGENGRLGLYQVWK
jgi:tRNA (uracil-5-)-methyltransferase TRM9